MSSKISNAIFHISKVRLSYKMPRFNEIPDFLSLPREFLRRKQYIVNVCYMPNPSNCKKSLEFFLKGIDTFPLNPKFSPPIDILIVEYSKQVGIVSIKCIIYKTSKKNKNITSDNVQQFYIPIHNALTDQWTEPINYQDIIILMRFSSLIDINEQGQFELKVVINKKLTFTKLFRCLDPLKRYFLISQSQNEQTSMKNEIVNMQVKPNEFEGLIHIDSEDLVELDSIIIQPLD